MYRDHCEKLAEMITRYQKEQTALGELLLKSAGGNNDRFNDKIEVKARNLDAIYSRILQHKPSGRNELICKSAFIIEIVADETDMARRQRNALQVILDDVNAAS